MKTAKMRYNQTTRTSGPIAGSHSGWNAILDHHAVRVGGGTPYHTPARRTIRRALSKYILPRETLVIVME